MTPEESSRLNQITEDSELLNSTLLFLNRLKEIKRDTRSDELRQTVYLLAEMSRDITERLERWPRGTERPGPYHGT